MKPFNLHNEADHARALELVERLWSADPGTPEAETLDVMAGRIAAYEAEELDRLLPPPNPRKLIAFKLRELGLTQRALARQLGWGSGRVSEVISGKRALTLAMVRYLAPALGLGVEQLVSDGEVDAPVMVPGPRALAREVVETGLLGHRGLDAVVPNRALSRQAAA